MELKIEMKQQLDQLLAKPAKVTQSDIPMLQELIATYPYYQPLYLLLAKASKDTVQQQEALTKAALYNNGHILHRVIHLPQQLSILQDVEVIQYPTWTKVYAKVSNEDVPVTPSTENAVIDDAPEIENLAPLAHETIAFEIPTEVADNKAEEQVEETTSSTAAVNNDFLFPEIENIEPLQSEIIKVCEAPSAIADPVTAESDEQETFEEINELVIPEDFVAADKPEIEDITNPQPDKETELAEDRFNAETFAATDFFAFDLSSTVTEEAQVTEDVNTADEQPEAEEPTQAEETATENVISKYDDDKLPFTFLWWLAKTRKDHEQIFRPFVSSTKGLAPAQHLQQQYVENIFHLQAPFELENELEKPAEPKNKKENEIIESFIKNDPQIKALPPNQINTENKAKKSAEDGNDLVSETLAQIYIEQMLYHKAIDTYQKLSLKFPEKSRYFADLIQSLEKKI